MSTKAHLDSLAQDDLDRIIQMAWEDRTSFDAIKNQFELTPGDVIRLMRRELSASSFRLWRARTAGRRTKHVAKRGFEIGRFRCPDQKNS
jgi:uncharacterized protein (TIGR03643 family)